LSWKEKSIKMLPKIKLAHAEHANLIKFHSRNASTALEATEQFCKRNFVSSANYARARLFVFQFLCIHGRVSLACNFFSCTIMSYIATHNDQSCQLWNDDSLLSDGREGGEPKCNL
jgi:hypothetical protein